MWCICTENKNEPVAGGYERNRTMKNENIKLVLENSKRDLNLDDFAHLFDEHEDLEDFVEEYDFELRMFLSEVIPEVMDRLKMRMAFASAGEDK